MTTMTTTTVETKKNPAAGLMAENVRIFLEVRNAYEQCDEEIKAAINSMMEIFHSPEANEGEKKRAVFTIVDALFPSLAVDVLANCERVRKSPAARANAEAMAQEEATFAEKVRSLLAERGWTQEELGQKTGVGQTAISNMLNRQCRPQMRTVARIAEGFGVSPEILWPNITTESRERD